MNINYDYYRIFYYVCRYGSFSKAAQSLNNNQPNITRAMNNLEAQLGVVLFIRSKKGIDLTVDGEKLYQRVKIAYEQLQLAEQEINDTRNMETGIVTVGVSEIALHEVLIPRLADFKKKYPNIIIKITNESSPGAIKSVQDDLVDFSIVTSPILDSTNCDILKICEFIEAPVMKRELLKGSRTLSLEEISKLPLIMLAEGTGTRKYYEELFETKQLSLTPMVIAATTDQIQPMVKAGFGVGFLPESMINKDADILKINLKDKIPRRSLVIVSKKKKKLSNAARTLMDEVKKYYMSE